MPMSLNFKLTKQYHSFGVFKRLNLTKVTTVHILKKIWESDFRSSFQIMIKMFFNKMSTTQFQYIFQLYPNLGSRSDKLPVLLACGAISSTDFLALFRSESHVQILHFY